MKTQKYIFISLMLSLSFLYGCQKSTNNHSQHKICTPPSHAPALDADDFSLYQIGEAWDRTTMEDPKHFPYQVFQLYRTGMGEVGTGVYLGKFAGRHIVMTAAHVYPELSSCYNEVNFLVHHRSLRFYVTCSDWHYKFEDNDIMLFSIQTENEEHLNLLQAPTFNMVHELGEALNLVGINSDYNYNFSWSVDDKKDCRLLSAQEKILVDPDCGIPQNDALESWSLPIGCDGKHGDSGAPVYDKDHRLKGLLWTGKYPKMDQTSDLLLSDLISQSGSLWKNYNYMVPMTSLQNEIETKLSKTFHLGDDTRAVLDELQKKLSRDQLEQFRSSPQTTIKLIADMDGENTNKVSMTPDVDPQD